MSRERLVTATEASRRLQRKRQKIVDALKAEPCMDCGGTFPPECMDFDHRPGETKAMTIARSYSRRLEVVLAEIAKCDLVCANCHRIRTRARRSTFI